MNVGLYIIWKVCNISGNGIGSLSSQLLNDHEPPGYITKIMLWVIVAESVYAFWKSITQRRKTKSHYTDMD